MGFRFRPTFEIEFNESRQAAVEKLRLHQLSKGPIAGYLLFGDYGELHLDSSQYRLWSPHLSFCLAEGSSSHPSGGGLIHARFAPRIEIWTFVWIVYLAMAFSSFFGAILVYSQWQLGEAQWAWSLVFPPLLVIVGLYVVAHTGQHLSSDQMDELRNRLNQILIEAQINFEPKGTLSKTEFS
jgi:hypothetical protein